MKEKRKQKCVKGKGGKGNQMEGTRTDEAKPHYNDLGNLPRFNVHAVCAPKVATGSNEPQKYFGRSDHVEALSQLGPLRSRRGMSQVGIPKMRQKSSYVRPGPPSPAMGTYVSKARETATNPRSTGPREALCGLIPDALMDMHTELKAVPHAGLGFQFLRVHV